MSIDTVTPRSRRALLFGALGAAAASAAAFVRPGVTRAADPDDVVLDHANNASGTTEILSTTGNAAFHAVGIGIGLHAEGGLAILAEGGGTGIQATGASGVGAIGWSQGNGAGVLGYTSDDAGAIPPGTPSRTGVYGITEDDDTSANGVFGKADTGVGVRGEADGVGVLGASGVAHGSIPDPIQASTGVYGISTSGHGVYGASDTGIGVYAANNSSTKAAIVAEGGPGTAIHGHANIGPVPASPSLTGVYGSATSTGVAIAADSASGLALRATSSAGHGIRGRGQLDGVIGESPGARSGVVGYSGSGAAPAGPGKTGVYGEATQDTASRGVSGFALAGQGVRGEATTGQGVQGIATTGQSVRGDTTGGTGVHGQATTGAGVRAVATTGLALDVSGRAAFSRSGRVTIKKGASRIDVTVPGGMNSSAMAFATLQYLRTGVYVAGARPNWPSSGKLRIYLNKALASDTPVAWFVLG